MFSQRAKNSTQDRGFADPLNNEYIKQAPINTKTNAKLTINSVNDDPIVTSPHTWAAQTKTPHLLSLPSNC